MKKWVQSLTSLVMSLALTLGLGGKALAAENESAPAESSAEVEPAETSLSTAWSFRPLPGCFSTASDLPRRPET